MLGHRARPAVWFLIWDDEGRGGWSWASEPYRRGGGSVLCLRWSAHLAFIPKSQPLQGMGSLSRVPGAPRCQSTKCRLENAVLRCSLVFPLSGPVVAQYGSMSHTCVQHLKRGQPSVSITKYTSDFQNLIWKEIMNYLLKGFYVIICWNVIHLGVLLKSISLFLFFFFLMWLQVIQSYI